jgi:hypothetical protein
MERFAHPINWLRTGVTGVLAFLLAFLLGAVPGMPSPMTELRTAMTTMTLAIAAHDTAMRGIARERLRLEELTCQGVWRGMPEMQRACETRPLP